MQYTQSGVLTGIRTPVSNPLYWLTGTYIDHQWNTHVYVIGYHLPHSHSHSHLTGRLGSRTHSQQQALARIHYAQESRLVDISQE
jgi:hypothetical protein